MKIYLSHDVDHRDAIMKIRSIFPNKWIIISGGLYSDSSPSYHIYTLDVLNTDSVEESSIIVLLGKDIIKIE